MYRLLLAVFALALGTFAASAQVRPIERKPIEKRIPYVPFPLDESLRVVQLNGRPISAEVTMRISGQLRMYGFSGCNQYSADTRIRFPLMVVGPIATTRKACAPAEMAIERTFLNVLRGAQNWDFRQNRLTIKGRGGTAVFARAL